MIPVARFIIVAFALFNFTDSQGQNILTNEKLAEEINRFRVGDGRPKLTYLNLKQESCDSMLLKISSDYDKYIWNEKFQGKGFKQCASGLVESKGDDTVEVLTSFAVSRSRWDILMDKSGKGVCVSQIIKDDYKYILVRVY